MLQHRKGVSSLQSPDRFNRRRLVEKLAWQPRSASRAVSGHGIALSKPPEPLRHGDAERQAGHDPIRPFVAEFTGVYAGYTCQELAHDYEKAFAAARKCAADFDWDAVVPNMVYVWTGTDRRPSD